MFEQTFGRLVLLLIIAGFMNQAAAGGVQPARPQIMIVGVAHFVSKHDVHSSKLENMLSPEHQRQIQEVLEDLSKFKPTKVMIEKPYGDKQYSEQYQQYLKGAYTLGANEIYQLGFRLAAMAKNPDIYPIDTPDDDSFPFDYQGLLASQKRHDQHLIEAADAHWKSVSFLQRQDELEAHGTILDLLRYLNTSEALETRASWDLYADRIGGNKDYEGADVEAFWYDRNLHIFANMARYIDSPNDRIVVFIGYGHAYLLRDFVHLSPDLELVDPETYLK